MTIFKQPSQNVIDWSMTILVRIRKGLSQKIVIYRSMTILKQPYKNVIDWSMTIFVRIRNGLSQKIVIDRSMTILASSMVSFGVVQSRESLTYHFGYGHTAYGQMSLTTVNDKKLWTKLKKNVIDWSMTIFEQSIEKCH